MLINLNERDDAYQTPVRAIAIAPFAAVGFIGGLFLSGALWGSGHSLASMLVTLVTSVGSSFLGVLAIRLVARAWRAIKRSLGARGRKQEPSPPTVEIAEPAQPAAVAASPTAEPLAVVTATPTAEPVVIVEIPGGSAQGEAAAQAHVPRNKIYGQVALICGGIAGLSLIGLIGGLVPATFGSVVFTLISLGGGALSYVLGRRRKGQGTHQTKAKTT